MVCSIIFAVPTMARHDATYPLRKEVRYFEKRDRGSRTLHQCSASPPRFPRSRHLNCKVRQTHANANAVRFIPRTS